MFTVLVELVERVAREQRSHCSPLRVSTSQSTFWDLNTNLFADAKQARDLVSVLQESKQNIDPRLAEMGRYSGGGGGRGYGGRGGHRGGRGGFTASNSAPLGRNRW